MIKYLTDFFYPAAVTYLYDAPKESVIAKIEEVLERKATFFSSSDMTGSFLSSDTFFINIISPFYTRGVKYNAALVGHITEPQKGTTQIKTKAKPGKALYFLFFFECQLRVNLFMHVYIHRYDQIFIFCFSYVDYRACIIHRHFKCNYYGNS